MRFIFPIRFKWMRNDAQQFYREKGEGNGERGRDLESNSVMSRINPNIEFTVRLQQRGVVILIDEKCFFTLKMPIQYSYLWFRYRLRFPSANGNYWSCFTTIRRWSNILPREFHGILWIMIVVRKPMAYLAMELLNVFMYNPQWLLTGWVIEFIPIRSKALVYS